MSRGYCTLGTLQSHLNCWQTYEQHIALDPFGFQVSFLQAALLKLRLLSNSARPVIETPGLTMQACLALGTTVHAYK